MLPVSDGSLRQLRARRRDHAHGTDPADRPGDPSVSAGNQSAVERLAAEHDRRVAVRRRQSEPGAAHARHHQEQPAAMNREIIVSAPRSGERGIAIVLSLFLVMAMSVIAASVMFMAQTETYGTMNYRMMSQARYAAESGVQKTVNYLLNDYQTVKSGCVVGASPSGVVCTLADPLTNYNMKVSPVTYNGAAVVLSADASKSNYPVAAVKTAFGVAGQGPLTAGSASIRYSATATLMSMQLTASSDVVQRWEITVAGTVGGVRPATEEVTATLETQIVP
ncbi:MAG: hypothetical protein DMF98_27600, partial [Acidobacteria bacterium]